MSDHPTGWKSLLRFMPLPQARLGPGLAAASCPRVVWIELTSKCPFDCVFCSRRMRRGGGVHMDMALYRRLLAELQAPEIIRLNYSGESTHHPRIIEAIQLAAATGATTELVTALGSLPDRLVEPLVRSGLDRLTVSLHTLDASQYQALYGYSSVAAVQRKLALMLAAQQAQGGRGPKLDFAVVAMRRNLSQLLPLAALARQVGAVGMAIHPVIRRDPTPDAFVEELDGQRLRPEFLAELNGAIAQVREAFPDLPLAVSTPEAEGKAACLGERPAAFPQPLPAGARIHSCDQNPWDTLHILADGSLVSCEVRDHLVLGKVLPDPQAPGLVAQWRGAAYAEFRARYRQAEVPECRTCAYKTAFLPTAWVSDIDASAGGHAQLCHGWHPADGSGLLWAKREAALELLRPPGATVLYIEGYVPAQVGQVMVSVDGVLAGTLGDGGPAPQWLAVDLPLGRAPRRGQALATVVLSTGQPLVPMKAGLGPDIRELGFGLKRVRLTVPAP